MVFALLAVCSEISKGKNQLVQFPVFMALYPLIAYEDFS